MQLPALYALDERTEIQKAFGGLDCREACGTPDFSDMENLSGSKFPLLSVRPKRGVLTDVSPSGKSESVFNVPTGGISAVCNVNDSFVCCSGDSVFVDGRKIDGVALGKTDAVRSIVPLGKSFYISPDGIFIKESDGNYFVEYANQVNSSTSANVVALLCDETGAQITPAYYSDTTPAQPLTGYTWVKHSSSEMNLYYYSDESSQWEKKCRVYTKITAASITKNLYAGDRALLSGFSDEKLNGGCTLIKVSAGYLVTDSVPSAHTLIQQTAIRVERLFPKLDFAVEASNRVFGCRYGLDKSGEFVNEIYASALGNPLRWYDFDGISTDSWCASLGVTGEFTGAAVLSGDVLFFKENCIIRISGSDPSSFSYTIIPARGVEKGSHLSVVNLNERLFYKSHTGIMVYDGAFPYTVSEVLSDTVYKNAVAGTADGKYFVAMENLSGCQSLFVYDTTSGMWHKEGSPFIQLFLKNGNALYMLSRNIEKYVNPYECEENPYRILIHKASLADTAAPLFTGIQNPSHAYVFREEEDATVWYAVTGMLGDMQGTSIIRALTFRLYLDKDSFFKAEISCNGEDEWHTLCNIQSEKTASYCIPVSTPRCDFYRLRFSGEGKCLLYALSKKYEITSEVNKNGR